MNAVAPTASQRQTFTPGLNALMPTDMNSAMRLAEMMAIGKLVPTHLQKSPGDCLMVIEQAMRWNMSPFAVAQSTSVIQGKLMFEGKLVSAALHASGALAKRLDYEFVGEGAGRAVICSAVMTGETEPKSVRVTLAEAKTTNGMWTKQPDQQLVYASTRVWARRFCPEVMLGVYSPEEMDVSALRPEPHTGTTIEHAEEPTPAEDPAAKALAFVARVRDALARETTLDGYFAVRNRKTVVALLEDPNAPPAGREALQEVLDAAQARIEEDEGAAS